MNKCNTAVIVTHNNAGLEIRNKCNSEAINETAYECVPKS